MPFFLKSRRGAFALAVALAATPLLPACVSAKPPACRPQPTLKTEPLEIVSQGGRARFVVELAETDKTREIGMMCRTAMAPDRGMLFDFHTPREVAFWMRNTLIPLDMVFIQADGRILWIATAAPLDETPVPAGGPIRAVLEIPGGRARELGVLPGDKVAHRIFPR